MTTSANTTKVCRTCGRELPLSDYYQQEGGVLGCKSECKHCYIERQQCKKYGEDHKTVHRQETSDPKKPRKQRVRNGEGDRYKYMHQYYEDQKQRLTKKNHADYIRRKLAITTPDIDAVDTTVQETGPRLCDTCDRNKDGKGCFEGFENIKTLGTCKCHDYRPRQEQ